jgi:hypothetical protein
MSEESGARFEEYSRRLRSESDSDDSDRFWGTMNEEAGERFYEHSRRLRSE